MLGLKSNLDKSTCYYAGTTDEQITKIGKIMKMSTGSLLVCYLAISVNTSQIITRDCSSLEDKICGMIDGWGNKKLSYAGRLILINYVMLGVSNYWAQSMFVPVEVVKSIENHVRQFLWSGSKDGKTYSKVAWSQIGKKKMKED
ncbi:hypothetical protein LIER_30978 [Lithospermum erythrorhizon]|uniref:Uncharacterized protein n=1 Tax=Lithospermum erythrorhizon TaxID=34254 RepID=A0AAV3RT70_LITER